MKTDFDGAAVSDLAAKAETAARLLATLANPKRLLALCHLLRGETSAGHLAALVGLSPAALSQHLARMRDRGLVATRRAGQTIHYRLASAELAAIIETLHRLYCTPAAAAAGTGPPHDQRLNATAPAAPRS